jgi:hypothetical protein
MPVTRNKIECLLLTWHGTLLCSPANSIGVQHMPLTDRDSLARGCHLTIHTALDQKFVGLLPLPDDALPYESRTLGDGIAHKAANGRGFNFLRGPHFLCAPGTGIQVDWNREQAQAWESFLPVPVELLIRLADLCTREWIALANGECIPGPGIAFRPDFRFSVGQLEIDLTKAYPTFFFPPGTLAQEESPDSVFVVGHGDSVAAFASTREPESPSQQRRWLRNVERDWINAPRRRQTSGAGVESIDAPELKSQEVLYYPPTFAQRDDRAFFVAKSWGRRPRLGYTTSEVTVRRGHNCHLMLIRELEGVMFDAVGIRRCYGFLGVCKNPPKELSKEGDRFFVDRQIIDEAPVLSGDYMVFYNPNLQNYYHWLVEGILSLHMLCKIRKERSRIVLPAGLGQVSKLQYVESLKLFGFGDIELTFSEAPIVRLERATWIATAADPLEDWPEHILSEFQSLVASSVAPAGGHQRLYVEREHLRQVENAAEVRAFLEHAGFKTIRLEGMPLLEQVRLFATAEFVVGPHGAGLANLLFTPPSARVIEFMPANEMRPFFWLISSKIGHEYGMLRCETDDGGFNGKLRVDLPKLTRLLSLLEKA